MPNGTSGLFYVKRADLAHFLEEIGGALAVGDAMERNTHTTRLVTPSDVGQLLRDFDPKTCGAPVDGDHVPVTQQDHEYYILHLNEWVSVEKASPLFQGLERFRDKWIQQALEREHQ